MVSATAIGAPAATHAGIADSAEELEANWREALASHLQANLAVGKVIPTPLPLWGEVTSGPPGVQNLEPPQFVVR